ncbi:MAG: quinone-dependent dihydroorotate dehydrogenase [Bacteroidetes bacterium]|nr:quinone-dependent dihydroorotate dehydrogenase [Bacteroidota bacterium]
MYKIFIKPLLFLMNPERAHYFTFSCLKWVLKLPGMKGLFGNLFCSKDARLETVVAGIRFPNRIGLAAGLDKDAKMVDEFAVLGFGFVEIGTLTPLPQPGNDRPRLFRLPEDAALINRMGFNNEGVKAAAERLRCRKSDIIVGGNIGKNKITANENAGDDYEKCFLELYNVVDYFVVNVSSPNTPGLRELQEKEPLKRLLIRLQKLNAVLEVKSQKTEVKSHPDGYRELEVKSKKAMGSRKPIFLKIAPDLTNTQLDEIIEVVNESGIDGIVATNTTISRDKLQTPNDKVNAIGAGGLSGKPLTHRSTEVIRYLHQKSGGKITIIGVGGIHSAEDAKEKLDAGASLVQLYTGFIYEGPALVKKINKKLLGN